MIPDPTTGVILSDGRILEATYTNRVIFDRGKTNELMMVKVYTGCSITHPDGQRQWFSNSWFNHIQGKKPRKKDVFL